VPGGVRGPLSREKIAEMRVMTAKAISACCMPARKDDASIGDNWFCPIIPTNLSYGMSDVIRASASGMLATMLVLIIVARSPEDIPRWSAGTEPITLLALGLRKRPTPTPITPRERRICWSEVVRLMLARSRKPAEDVTSPRVLRPLAPHLSLSEPLTGPTSRSVTSNGIRAIPA